MHPGPVEAWSGYPLHFAGQRRFGWQDEMAADLRDALAGLAVSPGEVLSGMYLSTDESRCDVENRLFTIPGTAGFPRLRGRSGSNAASVRRRTLRRRSPALKGICTTTGTAWAGRGSGGNPPCHWRAGTG